MSCLQSGSVFSCCLLLNCYTVSRNLSWTRQLQQKYDDLLEKRRRRNKRSLCVRFRPQLLVKNHTVCVAKAQAEFRPLSLQIR